MSEFVTAEAQMTRLDPTKRVNYTLGLVLGVDEFLQEQTARGRGRKPRGALSRRPPPGPRRWRTPEGDAKRRSARHSRRLDIDHYHLGNRWQSKIRKNTRASARLSLPPKAR